MDLFLYFKGVNSLRLGESGFELPSARLVSQQLTDFSSVHTESEISTLMLMQWGQFLDDDIINTPIVRGKK